MQKPTGLRWAFGLMGCLTMTYFRTGNPYYHRRAAVSRSCSGWEGVGPAGFGRQALTGVGGQLGPPMRREEAKLGLDCVALTP